MTGRCSCDTPRTAHEVRKLRVCVSCGDLALDPCVTPKGPMHVGCALALPAFDVAPAVYRRARICCLLAYSGGNPDKASRLYDTLRTITQKGL